MTYLEQFELGRLQPITQAQLAECKDLRTLQNGLEDAFLYGRVYDEVQKGNIELSVFFLYYVKFNMAIELLDTMTPLQSFVDGQEGEIVVIMQDSDTYEGRVFKYFDLKLFDSMTHVEIAEYIAADLTAAPIMV
jgi:hypothetical protein